MHSQNQTHPMVEPLEGRVLFATVDLSSAFGGSVLFARKDGSVNRVRAAIAEMPIHGDDCVIAVSASVGLASTDTSGYELQRLCKEAGAALDEL